MLIKQSCTELVPPYLNFVKGVIDCEDLPLNISRETYQDSKLILKLQRIITKRVLRALDEEARKDPGRY